MKIGEATYSQLKSLLIDQGLPFQSGPFSIKLHTDIPAIIQPLQTLYWDYAIDPQKEFFDFHISVKRAKGLRRWWKPQVRFLLQNESFFFPFPISLSYPLFEWGLNWCISSQANQYLIIHSAVLERNGQAIFLTASPGAGKSTLAAALTFRGWRLLSDELALIRLTDTRVAPLARPISIKNDSIPIIRNYAPEAVIGPIWHDPEGTVAHIRPPRECVDKANELARPSVILFMAYKPDSNTEVTPVPKSRAFLRMGENAFNYSLLGTAGFETMANLIEACNIYEFYYSDLDDAVAQLASL